MLRQVSPESEAIFDLIISLYKSCDGDWKGLAKDTGTTESEMQNFLEYAVQFLGNNGNYKGFGDSKIIPRCDDNAFDALVSRSPEAKQFLAKARGNGGGIYATTKQPGLMHLGFPSQHLSNYYPESPDITQEEIEAIDEFLAKKQLLPENTRLRKLEDGDFQVLIASALKDPPAADRDVGEQTTFELEGSLKGKKLHFVYGDYIEEMAKIALQIKKAGLHAANSTQKAMMDEYAKSFGTGSLNAFLESQKLWVSDKGPEVESNIGFIESYRDPAGVRSEWEGLGKEMKVCL